MVLALLGPVAAGGGEVPSRTAAQRWWEATWARHTRAVFRNLHPAAAVPYRGPPPLPAPKGILKAVKQVAEDGTVPRDGSEPDTTVEPSIAVDPNDPLDVVAVFQQDRFGNGGSVDPGYATSLDGGRTWTSGNFQGVTIFAGGPYDRASDPWVAFGPQGQVYAALLGIGDTLCPTGIDVLRSDDGGITWNDPVEVQRDDDCEVLNDKDSIAVDTYPSSPHFGRVYVSWDRIANGQPVHVRYSDDQGQTWSPDEAISGLTAGTGADVQVQPSGDVTVIYDDVSDGSMVSQTSSDGGETFGPIRNIGRDLGSEPPDQRSGAGFPTAAVDPVTGVLYAAWQDTRFRSDGVNDILVWSSTDSGSTWSGPVKANPDPDGSGLDHMTPGMAAANGRVHVEYFRRRKLGDQYSIYVQPAYVSSSDGGTTWSDETLLGRPANLTWAAQA
ncbi:MAG TPA: sialidase family protein, partial [Actinomycetota bacterium]